MILKRYHQAAKAGILLLISGLLLVLGRPVSFARPSAAPAITITQPDGINDVVGEGEDFATTVLGAPWDMNSGPYPDFPTVMGNFDRGSFSVPGGIWDAYTLNSDPGVRIHPTGLAQPVMKDGSRFPIDASKYRLLSFRMYSSQGYTPGSGYVAYVYWFYDSIFAQYAWTGLIEVSPGWKTYVIDLETYPLGGTYGGATGWDGLLRGLRIDPVADGSNVNIKFDWIRLTTTDPSQSILITWSGLSPSDATVDLYVDDDNAGYDGTKIASISNAGANGTFNWGAPLTYYDTGLPYPLPSAFEPGNYYVYAVVNGSPEGYSSGPLTINQAPMVEIARPSCTSGEDYASAVVGNPWDMEESPDIADTGHIIWSEYSSGIYHATSDSSGDPGLTLNVGSAIDSNRYRYLTFKMLRDGTHDWGEGWVARAIWWGAEGPGNAGVIDDIIVREGWQTYTLDLAQAILEYGPPWNTGSWTTLRLDPHEVAASRTFHLDYVLLTANDQADAIFNIAWSVSDRDMDDSFATALHYDSDTNWDNGKTFIVQLPLSPSPPAGPYSISLPLALKNHGASTPSDGYFWDTSMVPAGTYYIWVEITDGYNTTRWLSESPVVISH